MRLPVASRAARPRLRSRRRSVKGDDADGPEEKDAQPVGVFALPLARATPYQSSNNTIEDRAIAVAFGDTVSAGTHGHGLPLRMAMTAFVSSR